MVKTKNKEWPYVRIGLYDPDPTIHAVKFVGRKREATPLDLLIMKATIRRFNELAAKDYSVRVNCGIFQVEPPKRKAKAVKHG